jgi:hypothetical protein
MRTYADSVVNKFATDTTGNAGAGALITVYVAGSTVKAPLFDVLSASITNPLAADEEGNYSFKVADGIYDLVINEGALSETKIDKIQIAEIVGANSDSAHYLDLTIAQAEDLTINTVITTAGYYAANDGGGGQYVVVAGGTGPADGGSYIDMLNGNQLELIVNDSIELMQFGAIGDGLTNDANALITAIETGNIVNITGDHELELNNSQAETLLYNIDSVTFKVPTLIKLETGIITLTKRILMSGPTLQNLTIKGIDDGSYTANSVSQTGSAKNHLVTIGFTDTSKFTVGSFALVSSVSGTGHPDALRGCWEVISKTASTVTVKSTINSAWPTMTITSATVWPLNTVLRWPTGVIGLAITGIVHSISNLVIDGSWDITTGSASDGAVDGLQVGASPNTPETGFNESEQTNVGSVYLARIGIVRWENNATQVFGKMYGVLLSTSSCGWRGLQAARNGFIGAKGSSSCGNGSSGYEAEEGGYLLASNSASIGNGSQGFFSIGGGAIGCGGSYSLLNNTHGLEAKNFSSITADGITCELNNIFGVTTTAGQVLIGSGAVVDNNTSTDIHLKEGGLVNANGAGAIGSTDVDEESGCLFIKASGDIDLPFAKILENTNSGKLRLDISSIGDLNFGFDPGNTGTFTGKIRMKNSGTIHPITDGGASLGRTSELFSHVYAEKVTTKSPDGTLWVIDVSNSGVVSASLA